MKWPDPASFVHVADADAAAVALMAKTAKIPKGKSLKLDMGDNIDMFGSIAISPEVCGVMSWV